MSTSSPPRIRLPHASAGPMWCPPAARPAPEWHEIESLLAARAVDTDKAGERGGIPSFAFVAVALAIGSGVLAATLIGPRSDCGTACRVVTAVAGPTGRPAVATADVAAPPDAHVVEGRSVAEPAPGASGQADGAKADVAPDAPIPHRHHHRRRRHDVVPY